MIYEEKFRMNQRDFDTKTAEEEAIDNNECDKILAEADTHGLQLEVIWSAFKHKEEFPKASLLECLQVGADEWGV
jgi:hypothetical protein